MSLLTFSNSGNTFYYRRKIPTDLIEHFGQLREFRISLKCAIKSRSIRISKILDNKVSKIFDEIREGMKSLDVDAIISWSDDKRHKGTIYKASNFKMIGKSGGNTHGNGIRKVTTGNQIHHKDYKNVKTRFLYSL